MEIKKTALLILEDNTVFRGILFGAGVETSGEVVFNTGMTGYNETLTDPSYKGQIVTLTYPLIGNYGVPKLKVKNHLSNLFESDKIHIQALIVNNYSYDYSHWNADLTLDKWLKKEGIPAITGIDTRMLTKKLREKGTMLGRIVIADNFTGSFNKSKCFNPDKQNVVDMVSIKEPVRYSCGNKYAKDIVLIDCGVKHSIIRNLLKRGVNVIRVPWNYDFIDKGIDFDGVLVSNGPGDPNNVKETIKIVKKVLKAGKPILGICLGHQIMALAVGMKTFKLKYGHRAQNQPCLIKETESCIITSQNHGFTVNDKKLPEGWKIWFKNANDGTNEGLIHKTKPFFAVQFHPEASPGPEDAEFIFDKFLEGLK